MPNTATSPTASAAEDIRVFSNRAQALADGELIDVSAEAIRAGFRYPVAFTAAAYADCVEWTAADSKRKPAARGQDTMGRLWDVLWVLRATNRTNEGRTAIFKVMRIARDGADALPHIATLKAVCGPGDTPEPVITIMLTEEDWTP